VRALSNLHTVRNPEALDAWVTRIAVFAARSLMARRRRWRWLVFLPGDDLPEPPLEPSDPQAREALARTYALLARLPSDERIAFTLRYISGLELTEVADACQVSLATIKRRLARAQERFLVDARNEPLLREWLDAGRWRKAP
jgi:RNA polymerase sigma-70 factor (ECF subfamily)